MTQSDSTRLPHGRTIRPRKTHVNTGVAWYAADRANAERLWDTAFDLLPA
jgi:hypothetical protein